ncbi:MAG: bifunctional diaminohydroxyphosphoribosylaminopyrimidine deaminase/5-amino-6-(5-phosphoribosylamino)uracil reductase RibD [Saprospirales bacterium]|nr:bifunctional diaminohydroxyphosphoribosylaminopyrimidine deaminase/5-amino-6-(5-phosphoribosylamino)uracil reductase RibD [Saprospirales bacterium]
MKLFPSAQDALFIRRCFDLARLGAGRVSPNPMVGAVLVHEGRVIGEGYHRQYGGPHAEVEAIRSVSAEDKPLISKSTLYVSLEPCCVHGRTPPCTNLIMEMGIPQVVISNMDRSPGVNGKGVQQLRDAGVEVQTGILEDEGRPYSAIRNCFVRENRPYIVLKYAQSADGFLGRENESVWLTNAVSRRLLHKWRSEVDAILVGTQTLRVDNPALTNRLHFGKSPIRLVLDREGTLPRTLRVFDSEAPTWVFTESPDDFPEPGETMRIIPAPFGDDLIPFLLNYLAANNITSLFVEGGRKMLFSFLEGGWWDEARVLEAPVWLNQGIYAPKVPGQPVSLQQVQSDKLYVWRK